MYCAYATIPDYVAIVDQEKGLWFLSAVYDVFSQHAATTDANAKLDANAKHKDVWMEKAALF